MTQHPDSKKQGVNIDKNKYDIMVSTIKKLLQKHQPIGFMALNKLVQDELIDFEGSVGWYFTTVKLDLEAREVIKVDRTGSPQQISLAENQSI